MLFRSLPFKINTAILTTAVAISVLFILILYPLEVTRGEEQIKRINLLLETVFEQKINDLANELFAKQRRALKATLHDIQTVDGIVGVNVYEERGQLFVTSNAQLSTLLPLEKITGISESALFETVHKQNQYYGVYINAIEVIGERIGYIVFFYDLSQLKKESKKAVAIIFVLPIATVLLMAALLNLFLFRSIIQPVSILANAMRRVEDGRLGETVNLKSKDEIGDMGKAFNDMSLKLRVGHEALHEAEEKYRGIFENAIEGIFQYSTEHDRFITVNPSMATILGYQSPKHLIQSTSSIQQSFFFNDDDWLHYDHTLLRSGQIIGFETELLKNEGTTIWASLSARRVTARNGLSAYDEGAFVDITEQRQRKAAEQEREAAESASRAKSGFLAKMSHEIRTPLNAILGFADILENSLTDEKKRNYASIIQSSGANLLTLINDILDLSKIEAGKMDIRRSVISLRVIIDELINLFSISARKKNIHLSSTISADVPQFLLLDSARLRQVLFNLIGNAVKFTDSGRVTVTCSAVANEEKNLWDLSISVSDTGPGIEDGVLQVIFESFHQYQVGKASEGTGLGLAITKNLTEMMNGQIVVESKIGEGSTFTVVLRDISESPHGEERVDYVTDDGAENVEKFFAPACLLVVDDLEINRQHIITALKDTPLTIIEAECGEAVPIILQQQKPDLILMDIRMPGLDGYETIALIRKKHSQRIPVIAITAAGMKEDIARIEAAGFDEYLIRPFFRWQLQDKISQFLEYSTKRTSSVQPLRDQQVVSESKRDAYRRRWNCPRKVALILEQQFIGRWEKICRKQRLPDIIEFAEKLLQLGELHDLEVLVSYGNTLTGYAENVDIDNLRECLSEFNEVVGMLVLEDD